MVDAQTLTTMFGGIGVGVAAIYYVMTLRAQQANMKQTLQTRQAQMFMSIYEQTKSDEFNTAIYKVIGESKWGNFKEY